MLTERTSQPFPTYRLCVSDKDIHSKASYHFPYSCTFPSGFLNTISAIYQPPFLQKRISPSKLYIFVLFLSFTAQKVDVDYKYWQTLWGNHLALKRDSMDLQRLAIQPTSTQCHHQNTELTSWGDSVL
jgi:hypothetical protein